MSGILNIAGITFKGGLRDRVLIALLVVSVLCFMFAVPSVSSLSMRQVREVAVSLSLSIVSFVSLVLTIFLGVTLVYRDIERKLAHAIVSLPVSRESYLLGKYLGLLGIVGVGIVVLSLFSAAGITIASAIHRSPQPMLWENFIAAVFFEYLGLAVVAALAVLFSSFATTIFLPLFATIGLYIVGSVTQSVMEYLQSSYGKTLPAASIAVSKVVYYVLPNLAAFDIKFHAMYSIQVSAATIMTTFSYALLYVTVVLGFSVLIFRRRELT
jgi:ABC-type transport system involved in multi-copper enzyme maturation permease subunit